MAAGSETGLGEGSRSRAPPAMPGSQQRWQDSIGAAKGRRDGGAGDGGLRAGGYDRVGGRAPSGHYRGGSDVSDGERM